MGETLPAAQVLPRGGPSRVHPRQYHATGKAVCARRAQKPDSGGAAVGSSMSVPPHPKIKGRRGGDGSRRRGGNCTLPRRQPTTKPTAEAMRLGSASPPSSPFVHPLHYDPERDPAGQGTIGNGILPCQTQQPPATPPVVSSRPFGGPGLICGDRRLTSAPCFPSVKVDGVEPVDADRQGTHRLKSRPGPPVALESCPSLFPPTAVGSAGR